MAKPGDWGYRPSRARRAVNAVAGNVKDGTRARARQAVMRLRGHTVTCRDCGKTFRGDQQRYIHKTRTHDSKTRTTTKAKPGRKGHYGNCCGENFHSNTQQKEHMLRHTEDRARGRQTERDRRTAATQARTARNGRPAAPPKDRMQDKARRTLQANGRLDANGKRIPHTPHPKVRFRTPKEPAVK